MSDAGGETPPPEPKSDLGTITAAVNERIASWQADGFYERMNRRDPTLWGDADTPELVDRLGWLDLPVSARDELPTLLEVTESMATGTRHVVLVGMGGSSLAPEMFHETYGNLEGRPELIVLDSTHPVAVARVREQIDPASTVFVVSSKSGTTLETLSLFRFFWNETRRAVDRPGRQFVAITDPLTPLVHLAAERDFRRVFPAPADVGGRYSALTPFGLAPAAMVGVDVERVLDAAASERARCGSEATPECLRLGAILAEAALAGRDKATFITSPDLASFPAWVEQLIAESTGKDDTGIVPVTGEPLGPPEIYGDDRLFIELTTGATDPRLDAVAAAGHPVVRYRLDHAYDLGAQIYRFEVAVAAAGAALDIHPFNQPDVQVAKDLARRAMSGEDLGEVREHAVDDSTTMDAFAAWREGIEEGDYVGVHAYLPASESVGRRLDELAIRLREVCRVAVTVGHGPRFLHSTGQLHKGGPASGVFIQLVDDTFPDVAVPETDYTFGELIRAQSVGDYNALVQRDRAVLRIHLGRDPVAGLDSLLKGLGN